MIERVRPLVPAVAIAIVLLLSAVAAMAPADGQLANNSTYYENQSSNINNESWLANRQDPTVANFTHYLTRVGGFYIGQQSAQGGVGPAGAMLLSLVLFGAVIGGMRNRRVGPVAGVVLAITLAFAVVTAGTAPNWIYAIALFAIGIVLSAITVRLLR